MDGQFGATLGCFQGIFVERQLSLKVKLLIWLVFQPSTTVVSAAQRLEQLRRVSFCDVARILNVAKGAQSRVAAPYDPVCAEGDGFLEVFWAFQSGRRLTMISHNIKTTYNWSKHRWWFCYNEIFCWEPLDPGIQREVALAWTTVTASSCHSWCVCCRLSGRSYNSTPGSTWPICLGYLRPGWQSPLPSCVDVLTLWSSPPRNTFLFGWRLVWMQPNQNIVFFS